jgi:RNA polymerase sigma-70 factor (ECF subfamily)
MPFLAVPTKKIAADPLSPTIDGSALRHALAAVLREDLGLRVGRPSWESRLPRAAVEMCSPAQRVPTTYAIWPVVVPVDPVQHDALRARLGGEWLTEREALRRPYLSPTARCVLERGELLACRPAAAEATAGGARLLAADDWTLRLLAARAGDGAAFGAVFEEMKPWLRARLRACACTSALRPDEVEDVLQDGALNALRHLRRFDPCRGSAATWLRTLTHHAAVTLLRRRGRVVVSLGHEDGPGGDVADDAGDPAVLSQRREEFVLARRRLEQALLMCGARVRRAWTLRHVEHRPYAAIAAEMGQPLGTIATWIHRVKRVARGLAARDGQGGRRVAVTAAPPCQSWSRSSL